MLKNGKSLDSSSATKSTRPEPPFLYQSNLAEMLDARAHALNEKIAFRFLNKPPSLDGESLTYSQLQQRAQALASHLLQVARPQDRALLVYECNLEYIIGFFACIYAGVVAVPVYPPTSPQHLQRLQAIIADCEPSVTLTTQALKGLCPLNLPCVVNDKCQQLAPGHQTLPVISGQDLAFLQYTSGSTGDPKGVMLTHRNLIANLKMIIHGFQLRSDDVHMSWLPMYHDMGLIGGILGSIAIGITSYLISPMTVVRPYRWLKMVSDLKITLIGAPNFAFDLCSERISDEEVTTLDLSQLRLFFTGAEPIRATTMNRFCEKFAASGIRSEVITPCYGLAEATLMLTSEEPGRGLQIQGTQPPLVSCGRSVPGVDLRIVDDSGQKLSAFEIGEVWASGDNITSGYWKRPQINAEAFVTLPGHERRPHLRTGDMGYLDPNGNLFITGRKKEMIIIRGKNYFPQDIETAAKKAHSLTEFSVMAAFSVEVMDEEKLFLAVEIPAGSDQGIAQEAQASIQRMIQQEFALVPHQILLVRKGQIPRTSSGKIRRLACRQLVRKNQISCFRDNWENSEIYRKMDRKLRKAMLIAQFQVNNLRREFRSTLPLVKRGKLSSLISDLGKR